MKPTPLPWIYASAGLAVLLWGASPVGTKVALVEVSPLAVMAIRTTAGGLGGLILATALKIALPKSRWDAVQVALAGLCGMVAFPSLFSLGMNATSASHGAMILACMPVLTSAIVSAVDRKMPSALWWLGCLIAVAGEALLAFSTAASATAEATLLGDFLVFSSTVFACSGYVIGGRLQSRGYPARGITFWGAAISGALLVPFLPWLVGSADFVKWTAPTWFALAYLAFGVTILGYVCWYWALGRGGVGRISLMQFLQPVSGVVLSMIILGDHISTALLAASVLVVTGASLSARGVS